MATNKGWGFDVEDLEPSIRPQDDFFTHVNKRWMDSNEIPDNEARWGSFITLRFETDKKLYAILKELETKRNLPVGSPERLIRNFYRSGMDMKRRNALGLAPLASYRELIGAIDSTERLLSVIAKLHRVGVGVAFGVGMDQDAKKSTRYLLHVHQDGIGMPDRDYYLNDDAESVRVRTAYVTHVTRLFELMGRTKAEAIIDAEVVIALETKLAKAMMKKEDSRDMEKTYHKVTLASLKREAVNIDWDRYFKLSSAKEVKELIVMQPRFLQAVDRMLSSVSVAEWKTYLEYHLVNYFSGALSDTFIKHSFVFYGTVLSGTKVMKPLWRRVLGVVNGQVGELLGRIYVKKHFTPEAKKKMNILVDDLFTAYEARLKSLDWMTPATKKKALRKLHAINRKIGYPDKWRSYAGLEIESDDYVGNIIRANEHEHLRTMKKLRGPVDRGEWFMYPQTVNAYFSGSLNDIAFPAAILQPPFFSLTADDAVNYGCIGAVIGHEITHGFDDQGSKMDHNGNLVSWWTPEDKRRFEAKAKKVEKQFDQYEVADGLKVNGKLTLGENIADLGGLSIAFDAYQMLLLRTGRKDIDGLTPEQRFFTAFAVFERENVRPEFEKMQVLNDPHSPGKFRINGPVSNYDAFYEAYGLAKTDKLYRTPKHREMVW
jgi:putative endopeptidase